jgi:hypothetical protein
MNIWAWGDFDFRVADGSLLPLDIYIYIFSRLNQVRLTIFSLLGSEERSEEQSRSGEAKGSLHNPARLVVSNS